MYVKPRQRKYRPLHLPVDPPRNREVCYGCFRPEEYCYCDQIPSILNKTQVLILQHQRERSHPFNTARIVERALQHSTLIFGNHASLNRRAGSLLQPDAALLYPGPSANLLSKLTPKERPSQLVVLDGTWHHAKTMLRDIPAIAGLPRVCLAPANPGQYRIRLEPTVASLSTVEATVAALEVLEPETDGLQQLIASFQTMVETQLAHPLARYDGQPLELRKQTRPNIPYALIHNWDNIVIAYGESTCNDENNWAAQSISSSHSAASKLPVKRLPVYWVAQRLGSNELFQCFMQLHDGRIDARQLKHLNLTNSDFVSAVDLHEFRNRWNAFCCPSDMLAVYNRSTIDLLGNVGIETRHPLVLKGVKINPDQTNGSLESVADGISKTAWPARFPGRAGQRLATLETFAHHLRGVGIRQSQMPAS